MNRIFLFVIAVILSAAAPQSYATIPAETYQALELTEDASPKALYEALTKRYYDEAQGAGEGKFADLWEPIAFSKYMDPNSFYEAPDLDMNVKREDCVQCHQAISPGWVHSWQKSVHGNLQEIRDLPATDSRSYKMELIEKVETNLHDMGILQQNEPLSDVGCIDCHMGVGMAAGNHKSDLKMPDAADCGQCHVREFAERESERDTQTWPHDQWPKGRPSHALSYIANVETAIWAGMHEREVAEGCTMCHTTQNTCNSCHTRHEFSAAEARKPEACSTCHNGVDHNEYENFLLSKHGVIYTSSGHKWDWEKPLKDVFTGGQTGPTCQTCHMEFNGEFSHNMVQKVRWGFNPMPEIADNLDHEWFTSRRQSWLRTCTQCHSASFADSYLDMIDNGTISGVDLVKQASAVMNKLYDDQLLVGQKTNRPAPPHPDKDEAGGFFSLFWGEGNNPTAIDVEFAEMWEQHMMKHFKGLAHVNPGGFTYTEGWSKLIRSLARIKDADTQLRERAALEQRVTELETAITNKSTGMLDIDIDSSAKRITVAGFGLSFIGIGLILILGVGTTLHRRRTRLKKSRL